MNIAVLGLGFMGSTHLKAIRNVSSAHLGAVVSSDRKKLEGDLSGIQGNLGGPGEKLDFGAAARYTTIEEALADPAIEAVDICLPTNLHAPVTLAALRAGKHVLVEKPMALTVAEAEAMLAEAEKQKRVLMVAQVLRFFPDYVAAGHAAPALGTPRSALFRRRCAAPFWSDWLSDRSRSGGGVFDLLIHDVDFCLYLFGAPKAVRATGYENLAAGVDVIHAEFEYEGFSAIVSGGWHHPKAYPFSMEFTLVYDGGALEYGSEGRPLALYDAKGESRHLELPIRDGFEAEIEYFLDCARAGRQPEICPPAGSAAAMRAALAMVESRAKNGERVSCSR
ncbi:MAG: Gfo/Idh/MocA family oxidoreductase [Bryobacterales bacterium]|nr:Gfo/Idh/MocA family oxidoreductase [Bryobacterales bacterium]